MPSNRSNDRSARVELPLAAPASALAVALACIACGAEQQTSSEPAADAELEWAEIVERAPDPAIVRDAELRRAIEATGLPWRVRHRASGIELLLVPPGESMRGASEDDLEAFEDERPRHLVRVVEPFYLGRCEVTQAEWRRALGSSPSHFDGDDARPVEQVSRFDVQELLARCGFELPTEAQWEHACRAGDARPRHGELDAIAWHRGTAAVHTHPVGTKEANALGFHDMLGNVWEWTSSWYRADEYARCAGGIEATREPRLGTVLVLRGGSWYEGSNRVRASARYGAAWSFAAGNVGLRVVKRVGADAMRAPP